MAKNFTPTIFLRLVIIQSRYNSVCGRALATRPVIARSRQAEILIFCFDMLRIGCVHVSREFEIALLN